MLLILLSLVFVLIPVPKRYNFETKIIIIVLKLFPPGGIHIFANMLHTHVLGKLPA